MRCPEGTGGLYSGRLSGDSGRTVVAVEVEVVGCLAATVLGDSCSDGKAPPPPVEAGPLVLGRAWGHAAWVRDARRRGGTGKVVTEDSGPRTKKRGNGKPSLLLLLLLLWPDYGVRASVRERTQLRI